MNLLAYILILTPLLSVKTQGQSESMKGDSTLLCPHMMSLFSCQTIQLANEILFSTHGLMSVCGSVSCTRRMILFNILYFFLLVQMVGVLSLQKAGDLKSQSCSTTVFIFFTRQSNYILCAKKLYQQFIVDAYAKIECSRLQ